MTRALAGLVLLLVLAACGESSTEARADPSSRPTPRDSATVPPTSSPSPAGTATPVRRQRGIDVSHHQGNVDWERVRRSGIAFAFLKASEGTGFTDPRFASHARVASGAGVRVGGYHYFSMCSPGAEQADHFVGVLEGAGLPSARSLPPAIDLELLGHACSLPARDAMLREVRDFLQRVEERTGQEVVVYAYPDFEDRYQVRRSSPAACGYVGSVTARRPESGGCGSEATQPGCPASPVA